jgi:hypothetical protein
VSAAFILIGSKVGDLIRDHRLQGHHLAVPAS